MTPTERRAQTPAAHVHRRRLVAFAGVLIVAAAGCASTLPPSVPPSPTASASPTTTQTPTVTEAPATYPLAPPKAIQDWFTTKAHTDFRPLTASQLASVTVTREQAEARAL